MNKEDELQQLFQDFHPELSSNRLFMKQLNRKLDAVEYIKQVQDRQIRRYRYAVLAAFFSGVVCCAVLFAVVWSMPDTAPLVDLGSELKFLVFWEEHSRMLVLTLIALLMSFCIINGVSVIHDCKEVTPRTV